MKRWKKPVAGLRKGPFGSEEEEGHTPDTPTADITKHQVHAIVVGEQQYHANTVFALLPT